MTGGQRALAVVAGAIGFLVISWTIAFCLVFVFSGVMTVRIDPGEDGPGLYLPVPLALVNVAVSAGRHVVDSDELVELEAHIGEWAPLVSEILEVLENCPDVTLVDVQHGDGQVRVVKEGRYLKIYVHDGRELSVQVSLPTRSVRRTVERLVS